MNNIKKEIRQRLSVMATREARAWVKQFELPEREETAIILCDIERKSLTAAADVMNVCTACVSQNKNNGYARIYRELCDNETS